MNLGQTRWMRSFFHLFCWGVERFRVDFCLDFTAFRAACEDLGECLGVRIGHMGYGEDIGEPGVGWKLSQRFATVIKLCHVGKAQPWPGPQRCGVPCRMAISSPAAPTTGAWCFGTSPTAWRCEPRSPGLELAFAQALRRFKAHENGILGLAYGFGHLVTCSGDKTVKIWDLETGEMELEIATRGAFDWSRGDFGHGKALRRNML